MEDREALAEALAELFNREDIYTAEEEARAATAVSSLSEEIESNAQKLAQANDEEEGETEDSQSDSTDDEEESADGSLTENDKVTVDELKEMLSSNVNNFLPVTVRTYTYDVGVKVAQIIAENRDLYPGFMLLNKPCVLTLTVIIWGMFWAVSERSPNRNTMKKASFMVMI